MSKTQKPSRFEVRLGDFTFEQPPQIELIVTIPGGTIRLNDFTDEELSFLSEKFAEARAHVMWAQASYLYAGIFGNERWHLVPVHKDAGMRPALCGTFPQTVGLHEWYSLTPMQAPQDRFLGKPVCLRCQDAFSRLQQCEKEGGKD